MISGSAIGISVSSVILLRHSSLHSFIEAFLECVDETESGKHPTGEREREGEICTVPERNFRGESVLRGGGTGESARSLALRLLVEYPPDRFLPVWRHECQGCLPLSVLYVGLSSGLNQEPADFPLPVEAHGIGNRGGHVQRRVVHVVDLVHVRSGLAQQHLLNEETIEELNGRESRRCTRAAFSTATRDEMNCKISLYPPSSAHEKVPSIVSICKNCRAFKGLFLQSSFRRSFCSRSFSGSDLPLERRGETLRYFFVEERVYVYGEIMLVINCYRYQVLSIWTRCEMK